MRTLEIRGTDVRTSRIGYGCANLVAWEKGDVDRNAITEAERLVLTAHDCGITLFDHADVYAFGRAESAFGQILKRNPSLRDKIILQTKCGQILPDDWAPGKPITVDLSARHIIQSAENSLRRLQTDRLDILLLHASSPLMETEEIASAYDKLQKSGKVCNFGVSNWSASQIRLLSMAAGHPVAVNQVRIGLGHPDLIVEGHAFTLALGGGDYRHFEPSSATLDHCRMEGVQTQAWSPLRGLFSDAGRADQSGLTASLALLAQRHGVSVSAIALAWLLKVPAGIVPVIGSGAELHIRECCEAERVDLTDEEWFELLGKSAQAGRQGDD